MPGREPATARVSAGALPPYALGPVALVAAVSLLVHAVCIERYGVFRDELYYVACGEHLAWGYVDHPPLVALLARIVRGLMGESLVALRALPVALSAATILVTAALARRLGGGRFAQTLAALAVLAAPHYLAIFHYFSMNAVEVFLWTLGALLVVRAIGEKSRLDWLLFGLVAGLGLLDKLGMGVFGLGIGVGLLLTGARAELRRPWSWIAALLALLLFAPHVAWQIEHGWPTREFVENAQREKIVASSPAEFARELVLMMNPLLLPLWLAGLVSAFRGDERRRVLGWAFVVVVAVFALQRSKPYYVTPAFTLLAATGACALEPCTERRALARGAIVALAAASGLVLAPFAIPLLSVERFVAYQDAFGLRPRAAERQALGELPQHFADMFGWEELARAASEVYLALPEPERAGARIFAGNYGEAGAIDFFRSRYPLPRVLCPHNSYWYWGALEEGGTLIVIGGEREDHLDSFEEVQLAGRGPSRYCMPYERDLALWVCRGWKVKLEDVWPAERRFI